MISPFVKSPLGGTLGTRTVSFLVLDPTGTVPIEPLIDLVPDKTTLRVLFDMIDSEDGEQAYSITDHAMQDFSAASSNSNKELERRTFSGTLTGTESVPGVGAVGPVSSRNDLIKLDRLRAIADQRVPIMVVSPRRTFPKAFIESISDSWTPELGPNSLVSITIKEARIVSPLLADGVVPDLAASLTGNNSTESIGSQGTKLIEVPGQPAFDVSGIVPLPFV